VVSRLAKSALLVYQAIWLCVIVPGHTRGSVILPGSASSVQVSCCGPTAKSDPRKTDPGKRRDNCAICNFAARLSPAVAIVFVPPPMQLLHDCAPEARQSAPALPFHATFFGRAPPAA
jgi:hypothetical protein